MSNNYFNSTGTIGFTCDVCGRELQSCTWISGMRFCAKCYQETFGASKDWQLLDKDKTIAEQQKQIADLEAKLAESDAYKLRIELAGATETIEVLRKQLAEKEQTISNLIEDSKASKELLKKEIENLNKEFMQAVKDWKSLVEKKNKDIAELEEHDNLYHNQLAIEQLEKVKEKVICGVMDISNNYWSCFVKDGSQYMTSEDLYDALEQEFIHQIEELKKEISK